MGTTLEKGFGEELRKLRKNSVCPYRFHPARKEIQISICAGVEVWSRVVSVVVLNSEKNSEKLEN